MKLGQEQKNKKAFLMLSFTDVFSENAYAFSTHFSVSVDLNRHIGNPNWSFVQLPTVIFLPTPCIKKLIYFRNQIPMDWLFKQNKKIWQWGRDALHYHHQIIQMYFFLCGSDTSSCPGGTGTDWGNRILQQLYCQPRVSNPDPHQDLFYAYGPLKTEGFYQKSQHLTAIFNPLN